VDTRHVLVPEVVPLQTPRLRVHLTPFPGRVHLGADAADVDPSGGAVCFGVAGLVVLPARRHHPDLAARPDDEDGPVGVDPDRRHAVGDLLDLLGVEVPRLEAPGRAVALGECPADRERQDERPALRPRTGPYRPDGIGNATTRSSMPSRSISTGSGDGLLSSASSSSFFFGPLSLGGTGGGEPGARSGRWAGSKGDGMSPRSVTRWGRVPVGNP